MDEEQQHALKLNSICRLCGGKIKLATGYIKAKSCEDYIDVLEEYNFAAEDSLVFPKSLCNSCKRKLDQKRKGKPVADILPPDFQPHTETCKICLVKYPKRISPAVPLHVVKMDKAFQEIGFYKLPSEKGRLYFDAKIATSNAVVSKISVFVEDSGSWNMTIQGHKLPNQALNKFNFIETLTDENVTEFCQTISSLSACSGLQNYQDVITRRIDFINPFPGNQGTSSAWVENSQFGVKYTKENFDTIRSSNCDFLVMKQDGLCQHCLSLKRQLSVYRSRVIEANDSVSARVADTSKTNFRYLQKSEMEERLRNLAKSKKAAVQKANKYRAKIEKIIEKTGIAVDEADNTLCQDILLKNKTNFEEGSPQSLLWQQQIEQASKKCSKSMKWHPLIIRWCLSIYHTSPAAYRHLASKRNNFLVLPHVNTIKSYIGFTVPKSGFNQDVIDCLVTDSEIESLNEAQKNVSLLFDEIKIKSGLAYRRSTSQLIGFTEMGERY